MNHLHIQLHISSCPSDQTGSSDFRHPRRYIVFCNQISASENALLSHIVTCLGQMMQVLPIEGEFGGTVLIICVLAVGTIAVHVWSDVKTTHLWICGVFVHPVIKKTVKYSLLILKGFMFLLNIVVIRVRDPIHEALNYVFCVRNSHATAFDCD